MSTRIVDKDHGYNDLVKRVFGKRKPVIEVGILSSTAGTAYDKGVTVLDVGTWNEFGTSRMPSRSFLRAWFDENASKIRLWLSNGMKAVIKGRTTPDKLLDQVGLKCVGEIQARISSSIPPPNASSTIARKGSSTTLIDTGQLRSSITHRVKG
jgi:hypothetical protein